MSGKGTRDNRSRLEKKLFLAQESPEPIFDLSSCELTTIPGDVFPLCRVLRKEALYLDKNFLTDFNYKDSLVDLKYIKVLNISSNKFKKLPTCIYELEKLEILDASNNQIIELPDTFGGLRNLISLNLSYNHLQNLPNSIGNCQKLEVINLTYNENLKQLPKTMGKLENLAQLQIDSSITYPPKYIISHGTQEIIKYLSNELKDSTDLPSTSSARLTASRSHYDNLQSKINIYEKLKEVRQSERMLLEKEINDQAQKELEAQEKSNAAKRKMLEDVQTHQKNLETELDRLHERKATERINLIQLCLEEERKLGDITRKITSMKKDLQLQYTKELEQERKAEEAKLYSLATSSKALEKNAVLESMEATAAEEFLRARETSAKSKTLVAVASANSKEEDFRARIIKQRGAEMEKLLDRLRENENFHKTAVARLLQKSDENYWELTRQVKIVEDQLAEITRLELAKKQLQLNRNIEELAKNRELLADALMNLLDQQKARRKELVANLHKMELMRTKTKNPDTFWMEQYDKLQNSKGREMIRFFESLNPKLVYELYINGVLQYLPMLKSIALDEDAMRKLNQDGLKKCGIASSDDRNKVLRAIKSYFDAEQKPTPSAPSLLDDPEQLIPETPAAYVVSDECVVCFEAQPCVIFSPCGHFCCCFKCFASLTSCPLCRSQIETFHKKLD